jgi:hypothetical protein
MGGEYFCRKIVVAGQILFDASDAVLHVGDTDLGGGRQFGDEILDVS